MLTVYRTVKAKYVHEPLATEGARLFGGRWNPKGYPLLYTTSSPSLALIESLVHQPTVRYEKLPMLYLITLEVPDEADGYPVKTYLPTDLPPFWNADSYEQTQSILLDWLTIPDVLTVAVPSVAVPMSLNYVLHPAHPGFGAVRIVKTEPFPIERRLWRTNND